MNLALHADTITLKLKKGHVEARFCLKYYCVIADKEQSLAQKDLHYLYFLLFLLFICFKGAARSFEEAILIRGERHSLTVLLFNKLLLFSRLNTVALKDKHHFILFYFTIYMWQTLFNHIFLWEQLVIQ